MKEEVKIGSTRFRYVELSSRLAYCAKFHEYMDGRKVCLSWEVGWPLLMQAIHLAQVYERQGHDQFYEPGPPDLPTEAHRRGYRQAQRDANYLLTAEKMENYDGVNAWQY